MSALKLAQSLIKIKSISPEDRGCFDLIEAELIPLGFQIEKIPELNCETLLAKYGDSGKVFCYLGHTDVVPSGPEEEWTSNPFEANIVDGELIGRGAADMKGSVAVFIESIKNFRIRGSSGKVNLALDSLPDFTCLPGDGPHLRGAISISPDFDYLENAYDDAKYGNFSLDTLLQPYLI